MPGTLTVRLPQTRKGNAPEIKVVATKSNRSRARRTKRRTGTRVGGTLHPSVLNWAKLLNDPFAYSAMRLGLGCLVETIPYSMVFRGSVAANADGSFALAVLPFEVMSSGSPVMFSNAGFGTPTWTGQAWLNASAATSAFGNAHEYRTVAVGLRVMPSIALTSAPGEIYAGSVPTGCYLNVASMSPANIAAAMYVESGLASDGASVSGRPQDLGAVNFFSIANTVPSNATVSNWSIPVCSGLGLPASSIIYYEAVMHMEIIPGVTSGLAYENASRPGGPLDESPFASFEQLFRTTSQVLDSGIHLTSRFISVAQRSAQLGATVGNAMFSINRAARSINSNRLLKTEL